MNYGNGQVFQQMLNERLLPSRLLTTKGRIKALDMNYSYDKRKLTTAITDGALSNNNRAMSYDALERITAASGPWGNGQFSYDSLGNIRAKDLGSRHIELSYNSDNRLTRSVDSGGLGGNTGTRDFSYDSRGNTITAGNLNFTFDYADQPTSMYGSTSGSYRYDGNLKRVKATIEGKTLYNVYNLAGKLIHIDNVSSNKRTDYINAGSMTVARVENNVPTYVHHDSVGSPVSGTNAAGAVLWQERYTPYGITLDNAAANDDQAGYTGHIKDSDTGLVYMQARYYDPVIGRFYSNDPVDVMDHIARGNPIHGFNRYTYANNNPYKYTDPTGTEGEDTYKSELEKPVLKELTMAVDIVVSIENPDGSTSSTSTDGTTSDTGSINIDGPISFSSSKDKATGKTTDSVVLGKQLGPDGLNVTPSLSADSNGNIIAAVQLNVSKTGIAVQAQTPASGIVHNIKTIVSQARDILTTSPSGN